jgi:uncharacterized tellurite resistance protein B-like protein
MLKIHRTRNSQELSSHLINLFRVAAADGKISKDEFELLFILSKKSGISDQDLAKITSENHQEPILIPDTIEERIQHLFDLVCMVVADHKIDHREVGLCQEIARQYGIPNAIVEQLIGKLVIAGETEVISESFLEEIEALLAS